MNCAIHAMFNSTNQQFMNCAIHEISKRGYSSCQPFLSFSPKEERGNRHRRLFLPPSSESAQVIVIDADPNAPIAKWASRGGGWVISDSHPGRQEDSIFDLIEDAETKASFVIIDTEGVADLRAAHAMSASDFVIVPSQGSALDQDNAARAIRLIKDQERHIRRSIPHAVLFTRVSAAIRSRGMAAAEKQLAEHASMSLRLGSLNARRSRHCSALTPRSPISIPNRSAELTRPERMRTRTRGK